ncbi:Origin recognition complex subunit 2 [Clonorchis sinensis]|uniref:Origin recognition complex subunit 2 n=1 Tax=Clonorchis sinensis TaxID=79923 RepID=A0A8T1MQC1_CLOSI|nr:Origin recognition complex subunit 2 [Clonorchis sinensis]
MRMTSNSSDLTEPNDQDISRLACLKLTGNDFEEVKENAAELQMRKAKSAKSMLLKAFSAQAVQSSSSSRSSQRRRGVDSIRASNLPLKGPQREVLKDLQCSGNLTSSAAESVDLYFMQHGGGKSGRTTTSNRTLSSLCAVGGSESGLPDPLTLERLLKAHKPHCSSVTEQILNKTCNVLFPRWPFYLREGFNILLYGVGSKRPILDNFKKQHLCHTNCIVIPGYELSLNIRQILNAICNDWLQLSDSCKNPTEQLRLITKLLSRNAAAASPLYLLIHNIDGPGLRNAKSQAILAHLASVPNIHIIASMDHINTPILWSHNELARFSWIWEDCTTFTDPVEETSYSNSPILQHLLGGLTGSGSLMAGSGGAMLASLRQVVASLTQNAREIFRMVAEHQLNAPLHESRGDNVGMPLEDLYWRCRDAFLTNSEATLRAQLTEFRDHKLMKIRKGPDGTELLIIPMENTSLRKFVENFDSFC